MLTQITSPKGQLFVKTGAKPYTRKDGTETVIYLWEAECAHAGCAEKFTVTTTASANASYKCFLRRHCDAHKLTRGQALRNARKARTKLTDDDVAGIRRDLAAGYKPSDLTLTYPVSVSMINAIKYGQRRK